MTAELILKLYEAGWNVQFSSHGSGKAMLIGAVKLGPPHHHEGPHGPQIQRDPVDMKLRAIPVDQLSDPHAVVRPETVIDIQLRSICEEVGIEVDG